MDVTPHLLRCSDDGLLESKRLIKYRLYAALHLTVTLSLPAAAEREICLPVQEAAQLGRRFWRRNRLAKDGCHHCRLDNAVLVLVRGNLVVVKPDSASTAPAPLVLRPCNAGLLWLAI